MRVFVGAAVVLLSVFGGFALAGGPLGVVIQPVEWAIIGGAAAGGMLISTPGPLLRRLLRDLRRALGASRRSGDDYLQLLRLLYELFINAKKHGAIALERDLERPEESDLFRRAPAVLHHDSALRFLRDSFRMIIDGGASPLDLEMLLDREIETHAEHARKPALVLGRLADTLPGLGIVAAVLGVVIAMQALDGTTAEIGHHVAVALVGTFFGVFLAYGLVHPLAGLLEHLVEHDLIQLACIKGALIAFAKGLPPAMTVEFARRVIPEDERPSAETAEAALRELLPRP
ncbi:MAG TPA: flagellar motor stator protein MotA [Calidithermus sp.]|nr:flagellar motor stator protein MotA [Calidithermus sp.]